MNCIIYFHGSPDVVMNIVEYLYDNSFTLENSNINQYMAGTISFQIPDNTKNKELLRVLMTKINESIRAQLILGKYFAGTKDTILNDTLHHAIKTRVEMGTLALNPQIRKS